jgi:hypothetical protein
LQLCNLRSVSVPRIELRHRLLCQLNTSAEVVRLQDRLYVARGVASNGRLLLLEGVASGKDLRDWAREVAETAAKTKRRLPGLGHPYYYPIDPRTDLLMAIARMNGGDGPYMAAPAILSQEVDKAFGRRLTLNVTGALGAIMCELAQLEQNRSGFCDFADSEASQINRLDGGGG